MFSSRQQIPKKSTIQKFKRGVTKIDIYGAPISLTYNKETTFKSLLGGIITIFQRVAVFAYLLLQIWLLYTDKIQYKNLISRDLNTDKTIYNLTSDIADFAIRLEYMDGALFPEIVENMD